VSRRMDLLAPYFGVMNVMTANRAAKGTARLTTYLIDAENSITAHGSQQADFEGEIFASQQELAQLAAKWPAHRLVEVWNAIPGLTPVKKFTDRQSAVGRIWKAIQSWMAAARRKRPNRAKRRPHRPGNRSRRGRALRPPPRPPRGNPVKAQKAQHRPRRQQEGGDPGHASAGPLPGGRLNR